jgi:HAD superfamily hydrolase (TIGR01509 family)|tara:strand:- start:320 stop:1027 length:708 start_codon:yes stop_codon:yes gene_type:complete
MIQSLAESRSSFQKDMSTTAKNKQLKAVLLDMDGTLVDHFETICRCYQYASEQMGKTPPTYDQVKREVGGSMPVTIRRFFSDDELEEAKRHWNHRFDEIHLEGVILLKGARELLQGLAQKGIQAAVFTNKGGSHSRNIIESLGLAEFFELVLGAEDTPYRKPQIELSQIVLERLGVDAKDAVLIGDSPFDIESAHCVGMTSFCVPTGSHTVQELREAGTDRIFESLQEIADTVFS